MTDWQSVVADGDAFEALEQQLAALRAELEEAHETILRRGELLEAGANICDELRRERTELRDQVRRLTADVQEWQAIAKEVQKTLTEYGGPLVVVALARFSQGTKAALAQPASPEPSEPS